MCTNNNCEHRFDCQRYLSAIYNMEGDENKIGEGTGLPECFVSYNYILDDILNNLNYHNRERKTRSMKMFQLYKSKHREIMFYINPIMQEPNEVCRSGWIFSKRKKTWSISYWFIKWELTVEHYRRKNNVRVLD